jgi:putative DNA primase/helicase
MNDTLSIAIEKLKMEFDEFGLLETNINTDGKIHRCKVLGDNHGATSGAYFLKPDYPHNAFIQNFKTGEKKTFTIKINGIINNTSSVIKHVNITPFVNNYNKTAYICYQIYQRANSDFTRLINNDYLLRKKVNPFSIKYDENNTLLIPARDINGKIWTLQRIYPDGNKRFMSGGKKSGMFHRIGWFKLPDNYRGIIFLAEGYATTASIYMATFKPCVCCFDAGNLIEVSRTLKNKHPQARLIICADNDPINNVGISYGIKKAQEAAEEFKCQVLIPKFGNNEGTTCTDFNDLHCALGLQTIKQQILSLI